MPRLLFRPLLALWVLVYCPCACGHSGAGPSADAGGKEGETGDTPALDTPNEGPTEAGTDSIDAGMVDTRGTDLDVERIDTGTDTADAPTLDAPSADQGGGSDALADSAPIDQAPNDGPGIDTRVVDATGTDASGPCGPCMEHWVCGGVMPEVLVTLVPVADECHLSGLSGNKLLRPDGTITENGVVVGSIMRTSARVRVVYPDGGQWLYCASPPICTPWP